MATATLDTTIPPLTTALVRRIVASLADEVGDASVESIHRFGGYSNDLAEVRFEDGRILMVKRARFDWAAERVESARLASGLLRQKAGLVVPRMFDLGRRGFAPGLTAYWKIANRTLDQVWPEVPRSERPAVVRSWGDMLRRAHAVRLAGYGRLPNAAFAGTSLDRFLEADLANRLLPAVADVWPAGRGVVQRLLEAVPAAAERAAAEGTAAERTAGEGAAAEGAAADGAAAERTAGEGAAAEGAAAEETAAEGAAAERTAADPARYGPTVVHADVHMGNVLCERLDGGVRCVGFIDLESAWSGPGAVDLASATIMHAPLFGQAEPEPGFANHLVAGYARAPDRVLFRFFRAYHYVNVGYFSALTGNAHHARAVAAAARSAASKLRAFARA